MTLKTVNPSRAFRDYSSQTVTEGHFTRETWLEEAVQLQQAKK